MTRCCGMYIIGGDKGVVAIWESDEMSQLRDKFAERVVASKSEYALDSTENEDDDSRAKKKEIMRDLDAKSGESESVEARGTFTGNKKRKANNKKK